MSDDISKKTVLVLLVLTVIISVVGTVVVLQETQDVKIASQQLDSSLRVQPSSSPPPVGSIGVNVERPPELQGGAA